MIIQRDIIGIIVVIMDNYRDIMGWNNNEDSYNGCILVA
jgi:hypothetical protein